MPILLYSVIYTQSINLASKHYIELILTSKNKLLYVKLCKMNITVAILYSDKVLSTYTGFCAFVAH